MEIFLLLCAKAPVAAKPLMQPHMRLLKSTPERHRHKICLIFVTFFSWQTKHYHYIIVVIRTQGLTQPADMHTNYSLQSQHQHFDTC